MICSLCNGPVEWQGPLSMLTHTECLDCGAIDSQLSEDEEYEEEDSE